MHRATPLTTSFRSYVAGGARSVIDQVDDKKLMQEMKGNFMRNETREKVESPQNYGFSSVVMDGDKDQNGKLSMGAEAFIGFMGGNRSFPVAMIMDDRRHRLKELEKGDVAMFRTKDDRQQIHMTKDGIFWSNREDRKNRIAMVPPPQQDQQQQSGQSGQSGQQQQKATGQIAALEDNKKSKIFVDQSKDLTHVGHNDGHTEISSNDVINYFKDKDQHSTKWNQDGISHKTKGNIARQVDGTDTTNAQSIGHVGPTSVTGTLGVSQSVTALSYNTSSDARIKSNDRPLGRVLDKALALKVRAFDTHEYSVEDGRVARKDTSRPSLGLIAQDVRRVFPEIVDGDEQTSVLAVQESKIGIIAVAALQEFVEQTNAMIAALNWRIEQLEASR